MWPLSGKRYYAARRVAARLDVDQLELLAVLSLGPNRFYRNWKIPKASGGKRTITAPDDLLKNIQRSLLTYLYRVPVTLAAHGGVPGRSIVTNATPHVSSRSALCLDIRDAFGSACFAHTFLYRPAYRQPWPQWEFGVDYAMLEIFAELTDTKVRDKRMLPQGAPTSTYVFDLICRDMDKNLVHIAENVGGVYTRYVDNLTFSLPKPMIEPKLRQAIIRQVTAHFRLNDQKTRYIKEGNRNGVPIRLPGVNIIDGRMTIPPKDVERIRMQLYVAGKTGNNQLYAGLKGHVYRIYEGRMPPRLAEVFEIASCKDLD